MNDSMILLARLRRGEMIREAEHDKLAGRVRRRRPRAARITQTSGGRVTRLMTVAARMRPTVTGR